MPSSRRPARGLPPRPNKHTISYQLRELAEARGLAPYALAKLAGVDRSVVARFLAGERDIRLETADRIAAALGLRLVEVARRGRRPGTTGTHQTADQVEPTRAGERPGDDEEREESEPCR